MGIASRGADYAAELLDEPLPDDFDSDDDEVVDDEDEEDEDAGEDVDGLDAGELVDEEPRLSLR